MTKKLTLAYLILLLLLGLFSYTQIDLNLTLSAWPPYQAVQQQLIQLGYFHRPLNALIYFSIYLLLTIYYLLFVNLASRGRLTLRAIKTLIGLTGAILLPAYPAFSHDLFNYIFDVKILLIYHQNPFKYRPLDFPDDLWTRFMHWTHRTFPYAPFWLVLCAPFLVLGFGKFILTFFNFKLLALLGYWASTVLIYKISQKLKLSKPLLPVVLWSFNPLVIFEGLIAGHLDLHMAVFSLAGLWFLLSSRRLLAGLFWLLAAGIKFVPLIFLPALAVKLKPFKLIKLLSLLSLLFLLGYSIYKEPQPWYWLLPLSLTIFLPRTDFLKRFLLCLSLLQPLTYLPFFYLGDYTYPVRLVKWASLVLAFLPVLVWQLTDRKIHSRS
ncbi:DUF2029 domain-containing protein [Patescibacteria group bacterium]|nr:DUF2029 domain-containing protein [Patescibacteria group bacterium]MBU1931232.1 DUF2029 domain-containing protein [Patescibacteria group bacterium]